jgi:hypothetical protein
MTNWNRFGIGGLGALLPVLATLLAVDLSSIIDHAGEYTVGIYAGTALRYLIMFILGGAVAALNYDISDPIKLVQLGIAAPALVASYINAQPGPRNNAAEAKPAKAEMITLFSVANAMDRFESKSSIVLTQGFFEDVLKGLKGPSAIVLGDTITALAFKAQQSAAAAQAAGKKAADDAAAAQAQPSAEKAAAAKQSALAASEALKQAADDAKALSEEIARRSAVNG